MLSILIKYFLVGAFIAFIFAPLLCLIIGQGKLYDFEDKTDIQFLFLLLFLWPIGILLIVAYLFIEAIPEAIAQYNFHRHIMKRDKEMEQKNNNLTNNHTKEI